jgi:hypothetical protein
VHVLPFRSQGSGSRSDRILLNRNTIGGVLHFQDVGIALLRILS